MPQTTEQWISEKIADYQKEPQKTVEHMLIDTVEAIRQFIEYKGSKAAKDALDDCLMNNAMFLEKAIGYDIE